jgi:hypothetical protein
MWEGDVSEFMKNVRMPGVGPHGYDDRMSFDNAVKIARLVKNRKLLAALTKMKMEAKAKHTAKRQPVIAERARA